MHGTGGATCRVVLFVLVAIAAADRELDDLSALVKAQGRLLEQMQQQLQSQAAAIEALELAAQQARAQGVIQGRRAQIRAGATGAPALGASIAAQDVAQFHRPQL